MWCWRRLVKKGWTDHVRNVDVLLRVKEGRNNLHTLKRRKASLMGHIWRRNGLLNNVFEGKRIKHRNDGKTMRKR
jgi:hypothetical protein